MIKASMHLIGRVSFFITSLFVLQPLGAAQEKYRTVSPYYLARFAAATGDTVEEAQRGIDEKALTILKVVKHKDSGCGKRRIYAAADKEENLYISIQGHNANMPKWALARGVVREYDVPGSERAAIIEDIRELLKLTKAAGYGGKEKVVALLSYGEGGMIASQTKADKDFLNSIPVVTFNAPRVKKGSKQTHYICFNKSVATATHPQGRYLSFPCKPEDKTARWKGDRVVLLNALWARQGGWKWVDDNSKKW